MKLGILMDPLASIKTYKDSSFAMLLAAQKRGFTIYTLTQHDLWLQDGITWGRLYPTLVKDQRENYFQLGEAEEQPLVELDVLLLRKDPPFNMEYIFLTYLLELAQNQGLLVINDPASVRDANEKLFTAWFPQCCPKTIVTQDKNLLKEFVRSQQTAIIKPLDAMGGQSVFKLKYNDPNLSVIIETMTQNGQKTVMAQRYIEEITTGDKRIILIDGEPIPYALARIPAANDFRGNLAAGAKGEGRELTEHDLWICEQVGPTLRDKGLIFVGLDVIGNYLTEINVTSPTGIRELDAFYNLDIAGKLMDVIEAAVAVQTR